MVHESAWFSVCGQRWDEGLCFAFYRHFKTPIRFALFSVNQTSPSRSTVMPDGPTPECNGTSVMRPAVLIRATELRFGSVNQIDTPFEAMSIGKPGTLPGGRLKCEITPLTVIRPIRSRSYSVNHKAPSGPDVIPIGPDLGGSLKCVIFPLVVIRPTTSKESVNHKAPSGPTVM